MKQSSIQQFWDKIALKLSVEQINEFLPLFEQAKAMHKKETIDSFGVGCQVEASRLIGYHEMAENYYNETFNTNEK